MKNQLNIRVSDQTVSRISDLQTWLNESQTGVVTISINQLYETERSKRMDLQALTETVARAISRLQADGVEGWGLDNPDTELFDVVTVSSASGCTSDTCNHHSHDPAAPDYKLVPKSGKLINLGSEMEDRETDVRYYALVMTEAMHFFRYSQGRAYWASIREIDADHVPEWAMASLAE